MTEAPEFSRPLRLDRIGTAPARHAIEADGAERAALARRFGLESLDRLAAEFDVARERDEIRVSGIVAGEAVQACVATDDPVPAAIDERVELRFLPADAAPREEELELAEEECETLFYEGGAIDLGEAAAQTLALALDPFPRSEGAEQALREAGVLTEEEAGPFGALRELREKLGRGGGE